MPIDSVSRDESLVPVPLNGIRPMAPTIPSDVLKNMAEQDSIAVKAAFQKIIDVIKEVGAEFLEKETKAAHDMRNWYDFSVNELRARIERGH